MTGRLPRLLCVGLVLVGAGVAGRAALLRAVPGDADDSAWEGSVRAEDPPALLVSLRRASLRVSPLHARMGTPKPGDWLARHPEAGMSFDAYRASRPNRPDARRTTLYLQPWGDFDDRRTRLLRDLGAMLGRFYGVPVERLEPFSMGRIPPYARVRREGWDHDRLATSYVMDRLHRDLPKDALAVLAVTTADLTPGGGGNRWVFGQASLRDRVGVCSLYRQGDPADDFVLCLRRTSKTAVHEVGHLLGIPHCAAFECGMNGSGSRAEADARPLPFCPECALKVWWACGLEPADWYRGLAERGESLGLADEARFWRESGALLGP